MRLLPETAESLQALSALTPSSLADHMRAWEGSRGARLKHVTLQVTAEQLPEVEEAFALALEQIPPDSTNPNKRGIAFHHICVAYLAETRPIARAIHED